MEGTQIGPYRVLGDLGSGGMGKVYLAEVAGKVPGLDDGCRVALKVIHPHLLETPGFFKRFLREAEIGKSVEQDNVVRCFDCDATLVDGASQHFLVMEYVEGQTLRDLLNELERVPEELCRHIGREIAKGLVAIHEAGVIHRDVKPENVLITEDHVVKVMDLGVARLQDEVVRLSQTGAFIGSIEYAPPEQFRGKEVDPTGDLYSLGVVLYELSTGQHPYRADDAATTLRSVMEGGARRAGEVNPQLSAFFEEVVHALAAKEPDDRFSSASVLLGVLEQGEKSEWWQDRAKAIRVQTKRPLRRIRIPRETALYGRDDDLARLHALYDKAKDGEGQALLIEGEAGIGKTRLVDEFVGRLRQEGEDLNFLFGSYPPGGAATTAGAFSTAYREQFGSVSLAETLQDYLVETPILIPAFAALLKGESAPTGAEALTKDSLQTVFVHATRGLAAERTTIVLIDDLHFAPEEGRALFASLALACPGHRILLLGTMRPGVPQDWIANVERLDHAAKQSLARLGPKDLVALLKDAFRSERLANELGIRIAEKSDGNPFFAFEIIRGLREGQFITQKPDGTWVTTQIIQDIQVPSSVLDLVNARVADLDEEERDLLDVAACCGFQFDPLVVADVAGLGEIASLRRLGHIEKKHRLVRSSGRNFIFDHHQVQEALYGGLSELLRERYHAAIGEALEGRESAKGKDATDLDGALCVSLCGHYLKGAKGEQALRYLDAALDHLGKGYLNDQAIVLADRALDMPGLLSGEARARVLFQKNGRLDLLGRRAAQDAVLAEARTLAEASGEKILLAKAETETGNMLLALSRHAKAREHYERSIAIARETGDRKGEGGATGNLGRLFSALNRYEEAREHHERSIAIAREIGDREVEGSVTGNLGSVLYGLGRYEEAREHYERSIAIAREIGNREGEGFGTLNLGGVFWTLGRYEEAREHFERSIAIAREIGDRILEAASTASLGNIFLSLDRYEEAREHFERSIAIAREIEDPRGEGVAVANLGVVFLCLGHYEDARDHLRRALTILREVGDRQSQALSCRNLGDVFRALGQYEEARNHYECGLAIAREIGAPREEMLALYGLACLAEAEDVEEARSQHREALAVAREVGEKEITGHVLALLGGLELRRGEHGGARAHLEEALGLAREIRKSNLILLATSNCARLPGGGIEGVLAALRDHEELAEPETRMKVRIQLWEATGKREHLAEAKRLLDHLVEHAPEEYRESMLKNVRLHREIVEAWAEHGGEGE